MNPGDFIINKQVNKHPQSALDESMMHTYQMIVQRSGFQVQMNQVTRLRNRIRNELHLMPSRKGDDEPR